MLQPPSVARRARAPLARDPTRARARSRPRARAASPRLSSSFAPSVFAIGRHPTRVDA